MKKTLLLFFILTLLVGVLVIEKKQTKTPNQTLAEIKSTTPIPQQQSNIDLKIKPSTSSANLSLPNYVAQSFNNCGPASLSMVFNFWGINLNQEKIADDLRPFHNPYGGVDDKAVFISEMASYAKLNGEESLVRPNGTIDLLKKFTTNGIPVMVTAWLHPNEDIGHYRIVKGYDDQAKVVITDDTYVGPNQKITYQQFDEMWEPFNYTYLVIYPAEKTEVVKAILGDEIDQNIAYRNALVRAEKGFEYNPKDVYARFNYATANYYLGNFPQTISMFEHIQNDLPKRMLWYQLEPLFAYNAVGDNQKVITLSDSILNNGNLAFSELYQLKGESYQREGNKELAKEMFEKALFYNKNYSQAKESLAKL